ncbi:MAG: hypothetical protein FWF40_04220 [Methanomassiliicoccaceae archaeon]|jgi:hypothetical protein|nr:hypothetical protein [Methanomassiliicoccaceae archaeon]
MRIIHAVPDEDDIKRFKQAADDFMRLDPETRKKFWTRVGLFDENGNVAEPYKDLLPEKA